MTRAYMIFCRIHTTAYSKEDRTDLYYTRIHSNIMYWSPWTVNCNCSTNASTFYSPPWHRIRVRQVAQFQDLWHQPFPIGCLHLSKNKEIQRNKLITRNAKRTTCPKPYLMGHHNTSQKKQTLQWNLVCSLRLSTFWRIERPNCCSIISP